MLEDVTEEKSSGEPVAMKRIRKKIHHFTKRELAAEEVIIIVFICFVLAVGAYAASVILPIKTEIVQCGAREDLPEMCRKDSRCCALLNQSGGRENEDAPDDPLSPGYIWDDEADLYWDENDEVYIEPENTDDMVVE